MDGGTRVVDYVIRDRRCREGSAERLWQEHGWGLNGWHVAALVGVIVVASVAFQLFG